MNGWGGNNRQKSIELMVATNKNTNNYSLLIGKVITYHNYIFFFFLDNQNNQSRQNNNLKGTL